MSELQATWCFMTTLCNTDERAANQRTFGCIVAQTLRNYNCGLLFRFEESVTVFFQSAYRFCCVRFFASDFAGVSDFSLRLQIFV